MVESRLYGVTQAILCRVHQDQDSLLVKRRNDNHSPVVYCKTQTQTSYPSHAWAKLSDPGGCFVWPGLVVWYIVRLRPKQVILAMQSDLGHVIGHGPCNVTQTMECDLGHAVWPRQYLVTSAVLWPWLRYASWSQAWKWLSTSLCHCLKELFYGIMLWICVFTVFYYYSRMHESVFKQNGRTSSYGMESKQISNDQELIRSDPTSCPQNQKGNN